MVCAICLSQTKQLSDLQFLIYLFSIIQVSELTKALRANSSLRVTIFIDGLRGKRGGKIPVVDEKNVSTGESNGG